MADRNAKVQERIREELGKNPGATTGELQAAAAIVDASVAELSLRQFNAGYVLPLKRRGGPGKGKATPTPKATKKTTPGRRRGPGRKAATTTASKPAVATRPSAPVSPGSSSDRERIRATLMKFAQDFSEAESRAAIVGVLSNLDRYVDRIVGSRD